MSSKIVSESIKLPGPIPSKLSRGVFEAGTFRPRQQVRRSTIECLELPYERKGTEKNSRKEVIQPQVLLQLPCYDFTPITDHTLGGFLPCGLEHRLLVQPTFVM